MSRTLVIIAVGLALAVVVALLAGQAPAAIDGDALARLLYLGIVGALVGAWAIRMPRQNALRNGLVWLAILFALVAAYALRNDAERLAGQMLSVLSPSAPIAGTDAAGRPTVTLGKALDGHFAARARIGGQAVTLLVDTGASSTVLTAADAARIGLDPNRLAFTVPVSTANGRTMAAPATVSDFALGPITRDRLAVLVAADGALSQSLLGMNFLSSLDSYTVRGDRLQLTDR